MKATSRQNWFMLHCTPKAQRPKPPAVRRPCVLPGPDPVNVPDPVLATVSNPLAERAEGLMIRIFNASKPIPLPPPNAPEVFKSGTRRVVSGPNACRRWGAR